MHAARFDRVGRVSVQRAGPTVIVALRSLSLAALFCVPVHGQAAPVCADTDTVPIADVSGRLISAVEVRSLPPSRLLGRMSPMVHVTTRERHIRDRLLFAVGDTVDTLRTSESLRQLRATRGLIGAVLEAHCARDGGVALRVSTKDAWSLRSRVDARGGGRVSAAVEEANLLGTGRLVRVYGRADRDGIGLGAAMSDPTLFHGRVTATIAHEVLQRGTISALSMQSNNVSALAERSFGIALTSIALADGARAAPDRAGGLIQRRNVTALLQERIRWRPEASLYLQVGAEAERTLVVAPLWAADPGPTVRREFVGIDAGVARRSARYMTVPWLLPAMRARRALDATVAEVPTGTEFDGVVALGQDLRLRKPAMLVDAWAGRIWAVGNTSGYDKAPAPRVVVATDFWLRGYRALSAPEWSAGDARLSLVASMPASRGRWTARAAVEHMADPDPDVRTLSFAEPLGGFAWRDARAAEAAVTISLDRSVQLLQPIRGSALDAVAFGATTARWEVAPRSELAGTTVARMHQAVLGFGLRLTPTRFVVSTMTVGVGFPLLRNAGQASTPVLSVAVSPAFGRGRQRARRAPYIPR